MKTLKVILFSSALFIVFNSCQKIEACLEVNKTSVKVGEEITFTSCSENADAFSWFGVSGPSLTTVAGGTSCDDFWTVTFETTGTAIISIKADKIERGKKCSDSEYKVLKSDETTVTITVTE